MSRGAATGDRNPQGMFGAPARRKRLTFQAGPGGARSEWLFGLEFGGSPGARSRMMPRVAAFQPGDTGHGRSPQVSAACCTGLAPVSVCPITDSG